MWKSAAGSSVTVVLVSAVLGVSTPAPAQPAGQAPAARAEAYRLFLEGLRLEEQGRVPEAVEAYERAIEADGGSADLRAQLAQLYARENRASDAIRLSEQALAIDPDHVEAHRVLGTVYAAQAYAGRSFDDGGPPVDAARAREAAAHLERARSPSAVSPGVEITLGRLYLQMGEFAKAADALAEFVAREPGVEEAVLLLATAYEAAGQEDDARLALEDAVAFDPGFLRGLIALAQLLDRQGEWAAAAEAYGRASAVNPGDRTLVTRQAAALINAKEPARARTLLLAQAAARPNDRLVLYLLAQAHRDLGDPARAEETARRLVELGPDDWRGPMLLGQLLNRRGAYRETVEALTPYASSADTSSASDEQRRGLFLQLGVAHFELGELASSVSAFERARRAAPDDLLALAYLAQALVADRQFARALEVLREADASSLGYLPLVRLEAEAWRGTGEPARGAGLLEGWLARRPDDVEAHVALGQFYMQAERSPDAVRVLEQAAQTFPRSPEVAFQLGAALERDGRHVDAEGAFQRAIALDEEHAGALNYLGYMLAERGERLEEAIGYIERALAVEPGNGAYLDSLGWAYFKLRRLDLARQPLERAAAQLSSSSVVQDHYGDLLFALGEAEAAIEAWRRALAGDGEEVDPAVIERKIRDAGDGRE